MRVLLATTHIHYPQGGGGLERNTHELCLALKRRGAQPAVASSMLPRGGLLPPANRLKRFLLRQAYPRDTMCGYPVYRGWTPEGATEVAHRFRPDIAVVQNPHPERLLNAIERAGTPTAVYVHEVEELDHYRAIRARGTPVIANSEFTARRLRERCGITDAAIVRPLIDPAHYRLTPRPERVLFINTTPRKGVAIARALAEARPAIPFDIVVSWVLKESEKQELRAWAARLPNVTLHQPRRDMRPLYARARLLLVPSQWQETWGRVATEAQINGTPVLASDRGGLPESVGPGGMLLPHDAPLGDWLAALDRIWGDPSLHAELSAAARAHASRPEIQPDAIADALRDGLRAFLDRGAPPGGA
ncbi:MAG: glycosyltransferase [Acetobacteraceae bacterium]|nr:glycosyltransferase [Acetobacteraceae bacterium]